MKTLVLGLGNPILGDDGVGWRVVKEVEKKLARRKELDLDYVALGGLGLMERMAGYQHAILVDSIFSRQRPIGTVSHFSLEEVPDLTTCHSASAHDASLHTALVAGRSLNISLPKDEDVHLVAIEAENVLDFSENLSPAVEEAVPLAVEAVLKLIAVD